MAIVVRNWRDQEPYVGHISALVWTLFRGKNAEDSAETSLLDGMNSFVKHGLQGRQHSDHHHHTNIEQMYFVLRGRGQLLIGDDKVDVQEGTAVYMPVNVPHQAFNDGDYWMEHLIVSCPLDEIHEGTPAVRDWRNVSPTISEHKAISWPLLTREGEASATDGGVLQRMHSVTRYAVQGRQTTDWQLGEGLEMVYFILSGHGTIETEDTQDLITEGTAAYVPPDTFHRFGNPSEGWLEYVAFAVEVTVEEEADTADEVEEAIDVVTEQDDEIAHEMDMEEIEEKELEVIEAEIEEEELEVIEAEDGRGNGTNEEEGGDEESEEEIEGAGQETDENEDEALIDNEEDEQAEGDDELYKPTPS